MIFGTSVGAMKRASPILDFLRGYDATETVFLLPKSELWYTLATSPSLARAAVFAPARGGPQWVQLSHSCVRVP
jgi:hypothetical protein